MMSDSEEERELDIAAGEDGDFADWEEDEEESRPARCLFSETTHPSATAALQHAADAFGFDLRAMYRAHAMDFYSVIQCLNYARTRAALGLEAAAAAAAASDGIARGEHRDEKYLVSALEDDPLLFEWEAFVGVSDDADDMEDDGEVEKRAAAAAAVASAAVATDARDASPAAATADGAVLAALAEARAENDALRLRVLEMSEALGVAPGDVTDDAPENVGAGLLGGDDASAPVPASAPGPVCGAKPGSETAKPGSKTAKPGSKTAAEVVDDDYFGSYSFFDIHRTMLDDVPRTAAYRTALERNPSLTRDAAVVDIGCGTGILSMFAARGGAKRVVGVDGAADIAAVARANVAHNGVSDVVSVVQGKVEELLAEDGVPGGAGSFDVLVSEWMGYALLYESMLDTVIAARDTLLKPGGAVLPDVATVRVAGFGRLATSLPFWDDVYGFEMPDVQEKLTREAVKSAMVQPVKGEHVVTESATVRTLDLATMTVADTEFSSEEVTLRARRDGVRGDEDDDAVKAGAGEGATGLTQRSVIVEDDGAGPVMCHGIVLWFDTEFSARFCKEAPVTLSTSPHERQTHWAQTMLHFPEPVALAPEGFARVEGATTGAVGTVGNPASAVRVRVGMAKCAEEIRARALDISLEYVAVDAEGAEGARRAKIYRM